MYLVLLTSCMVLFSSCYDNSDRLSVVELEPNVMIEEFGDSTYFRGISYIVVDDFIYAADEDNGRINKLDSKLNLVGIIGRRGQGPHDFAGLGCFIVYKDTILAVNLGGLSLNAYTIDGDFIEKYTLGSDYSLTANNFCVDNEGYMYFTSRIDSFPIIKFDRQMNRQFSFGNWIEPENKEFRPFLNSCLIACLDDKIITIQKDAPVINVYGKDGTHLLKKNLPEELFKKRLLFKKREQEKDASNLRKTYGLFGSVSTVDNKIYLTYVDHDEQDIPYKNKVVEILFENNDFIINRVFSLSKEKSGWFEAIAVTNDNRIVVSNASIQENPSISVYLLK